MSAASANVGPLKPTGFSGGVFEVEPDRAGIEHERRDEFRDEMPALPRPASYGKVA